MVKEKLSANAAKQGRVLRFIEDKLGRFATNPHNIPGGLRADIEGHIARVFQ